MPNIIVTETTGTQQVVGPDNNLNFLVSGSHSGDIVTINATGSALAVNIDVTESGQNVSITGQSTPQIINVSVVEGGAGGGSPLTVRDEGVNVATGVTVLDFVGAGVEASGSGGVVTVSITGSGGGSLPNPVDTQLIYNSLQQLSQKIDTTTTCYSYNTDGQLTLLYRPDYIKEFYYSGTFLTGIDVTDPTPAIVLWDGCPLVNVSGRPYFGTAYLMPDGNPYLKPDGSPYLQPA